MTILSTAQQFASLWSYYLFHAFWQASLLAISALAIVKTAKNLPSNLKYGILIVALLKFAIPFLPALSIGMLPALQSIGGTIPVLDGIPEFVSRIAQYFWFFPLLAVYFLGALIAAVRLFQQQRRLSAIRSEGIAIQTGELYEEFAGLARKFRFRQLPLLISSATVTVPFAVGLKTQAVVLPSVVMEQLSAEELRPVMAHELAHLRHRDQWINWLQALLGVVWWFNPVYHLLSKVIRQVREECRDDAVLANGLASSHSYSTAMLAVAALARPQLQSQIALHSLGHDLHPLANRLARIADTSITRRVRLTAPQLCLLVLGALIVLPGLTLNWQTTTGEQNKVMAGKSSQFEFNHAPGSHQDHRETHRRAHNHH